MSAHLPKARKTSLRARVQSTVAKIEPEEKAAASAAAVALLAQRTEWRNARTVLMFAPMPDELDLWPLVELGRTQGKTIALPSYDSTTDCYVCRGISDLERDLIRGYRGIREPSVECPLILGNRLDLTLVPGVAFDLRGCRLGRGKGFYDRILLGVDSLTCGAVFDQRVVDEVPVEPHDIRVNCILTPTRWIDCGRHLSAAE